MQLDYRKAEIALQSSYGAQASRYRQDDEVEIASPHHVRLANTLAEITSSFQYPISVLDVGCGTGRYFYCLQNVESLVGMDITPEMLAAAETPVNGHKVSARKVHLIPGNVFSAAFTAESFDFIYSLGMFGHGCPVTAEVINKFHSWLAPGGRLLFDVVDFAGLPWFHRARKQSRKLIYPLLPERLQNALDERQQNVPFFGLSKTELAAIMRNTHFNLNFTVTSHVCDSPLWEGRHLECQAQR